MRRGSENSGETREVKGECVSVRSIREKKESAVKRETKTKKERTERGR